MKKTILVTGDVVSDCHLYGAIETAAGSSRKSGTVYQQELGGMALTHRLLKAALEQAASSQSGSSPSSARFEVVHGIRTDGLMASLPPTLRSFGVWTPHVQGGEDPMKQVWRMEQDFGYGPGDPAEVDSEVEPNPDLPTAPLLTVVDDGGILFRHRRQLWPQINQESGTHYLLKTTYPLCRSALWETLKTVGDRLVVVVTAADLRREDIQISSQLSWEQAAEHTLAAMYNDPVGRELSCAAHVIVSFHSAGALLISCENGKPKGCKLIFDQLALEHEVDHHFEGTVYGFQTCLTAAIAHYLVQPAQRADKSVPDPFANPGDVAECLQKGIVAGLTARRELLKQGHGPVGTASPGFPCATIAKRIADGGGKLLTADVPLPGSIAQGAKWSFLSRAEGSASETGEVPLVGLGILTAKYGWKKALSQVPLLKIGKVLTADRSEIESLRTLDALIRGYESKPVQKKPLSIAVFGPPGAGKSFGVKALATAILGDKVPFLEFNLSQYKGPEDLIGALHQVRDAVLRGRTPVVFWDEFDSQANKWLQYMLAPMQDGTFQEGQITHPIGKSIFIFAGGTSPTIEAFGVSEPEKPVQEEPRQQHLMEQYTAQQKRFDQFKRMKGPDFLSRLHGFLNVQGPNRQGNADITWPVRRAILLRGLLDAGADDTVNIDPGLLHALLRVPVYRHGSRSFEKIVLALKEGQKHRRLHRSALPPAPLLDRDTDANKFLQLLTHADAFKTHENVDAIAAAIHLNYLTGAARSITMQPEAPAAGPWVVHGSILREYDSLAPDKKATNVAAARRIPDLLALIDFAVQPLQEGDHPSWKEILSAAITNHLDRLATAEHIGWSEDLKSSGWTVGPRNEETKKHNLLVTWGELSGSDQEKNRNHVRSIPDILQNAGYKAQPIPL